MTCRGHGDQRGCHSRTVPRGKLVTTSDDTSCSYGAASFLNAVAGIELFVISTSIVLPVRLSVTCRLANSPPKRVERRVYAAGECKEYETYSESLLQLCHLCQCTRSTWESTIRTPHPAICTFQVPISLLGVEFGINRVVPPHSFSSGAGSDPFLRKSM